MKKFLPFPFLLAGLLFLSPGCKPRPKPVKFNNDMARANQRLAAASKSFFKAVEEFQKTGDPAKAKAVRSAYSSTETTLKEIVKDYDEMKPPVRNPGLGADLLAKYKEFLSGQQVILEKMRQIVEAAEKNQLEQITTLSQEIRAEEAKTAKPLKESQESFAKENYLKVT